MCVCVCVCVCVCIYIYIYIYKYIFVRLHVCIGDDGSEASGFPRAHPQAFAGSAIEFEKAFPDFAKAYPLSSKTVSKETYLCQKRPNPELAKAFPLSSPPAASASNGGGGQRTKQAGGGAEGVPNLATLGVRAAELKEGGGRGEGNSVDNGVGCFGDELLISAMSAMSALNSMEKAAIAHKLLAILAEPDAEFVRGRSPRPTPRAHTKAPTPVSAANNSLGKKGAIASGESFDEYMRKRAAQGN
jgi:hypothetical protein